MNIVRYIAVLFALNTWVFCEIKAEQKSPKNAAGSLAPAKDSKKNLKKEPPKQATLPDKDLHISSDSMDYDSNTNIANAVGQAHAFRYVEKDGGVYKQTIDAKRFEAHFVPQEETTKKKNVPTKNPTNSDNPNIDIIKAFDDVVIDTASQTIWADVCTFEVQKDHIDCERNVKIKDKKTNNEVFGEKAKVNLKTEKYVIERGKKQAKARIVSNQGKSSSTTKKPDVKTNTDDEEL